jgi:transcriptional regulator with XRE-family HTH domain
MVESARRGATALHPLREARLSRGLSQEALAARAVVDARTVGRIERREVVPHPDTAGRLAKALGRSPAALGLLPEAGGPLTALAEPGVPQQQQGGAQALALHLRRVLAEYATVDNLIGPGALLAVVPAQLAAVEQLLEGAEPDARGELLDVAARCAELAGWVHQDAGDLRAADRWTARAADYALGSGDPRLVSYVLMRRSNVASDAGDAGRALALARAALREGDRLTPQLRAVALRQEAHAHALRGDAPACARALDRAMAEVLTKRSTEPEFDLTAYCTPGYVGMEAAACWLQLGQPKQAIATLQERRNAWPAGYKRDLGLCLARLAVAHAADRDLEQAAAVGQQAIAVVSEARSARALRELARLDTLVRRWDGASAAAELVPGLRLLTRSPAPAAGGDPEEAPEGQPVIGGWPWS